MISIIGDTVTMSEQDYFQLKFNKTISDNSTSVISKDEEIVITDYLHQRGFKRNLKGYVFIKKAISICLSDVTAIDRMCELYERVAKISDTTASRVERAIRHSKETAKVKKVCSSEFIATASDDIRIMMK